VESLNGKLQNEAPEKEIFFYTLADAKVRIEHGRREYNQVRPHRALSYRPPHQKLILGLTSEAARPFQAGHRGTIWMPLTGARGVESAAAPGVAEMLKELALMVNTT
jgi:hypothetical protein